MVRAGWLCAMAVAAAVGGCGDIGRSDCIRWEKRTSYVGGYCEAWDAKHRCKRTRPIRQETYDACAEKRCGAGYTFGPGIPNRGLGRPGCLTQEEAEGRVRRWWQAGDAIRSESGPSEVPGAGPPGPGGVPAVR